MVERGTEAAVTSPTRKRQMPSPPRQALRWSVVRVILVSQGGEDLPDPPGRDLLVSSAHTFADLAAAIDRAFARWDRSHLHEFRLLDGRRIVMEDFDEFEEADPARDLDEQAHSWGSVALHTGDTFTYVFDFGDQWEHGCTVLRDGADPA